MESIAHLIQTAVSRHCEISPCISFKGSFKPMCQKPCKINLYCANLHTFVWTAALPADVVHRQTSLVKHGLHYHEGNSLMTLLQSVVLKYSTIGQIDRIISF